MRQLRKTPEWQLSAADDETTLRTVRPASSVIGYVFVVYSLVWTIASGIRPWPRMKTSRGGRAPVVTLWHGWRSEWVDRHSYLLGGVSLLLGVGPSASWASGDLLG